MDIKMDTYIVHPNKSQEKALRAFLEALKVPFEHQSDETLPQHVIESIKRGQADIDAGRTITFEAFKEKIANKR